MAVHLQNKDGSFRTLSYLLLFLVQTASALVLIPINVNLIVTTFLVVYLGCESSLYAQADESETLEHIPSVHVSVTAGCVLCGLYAVFKFFNKEYVNLVIMFYIFLVGVFAVANLVNGLVAVAFPCKDNVVDYALILSCT